MRKDSIKWIIFNICLTSLFISLSIVAKLISKYIPPVIQGYSLELHIVIYALGLYILYDFKYKIMYWLLCPCFWFFIGSIASINALQTFVEYFLSYLIYIPIAFLKVNPDKKIKSISIFTIAFILLTTVKLMIHVIAGAIWWVNYDWPLSFVINSQIIYVNLAINIILVGITIYPCLLIKKKYTPVSTKSKCKTYYI